MLKATGSGWETKRIESYDVQTTLEKGADKFSLEIAAGQMGENAGRIRPGTDCQLYDSKGARILTGFIDEVDHDETIKVNGRCLMAYAIDSYPDPKSWKDAYPLDILRELAGALPFTSVDVLGITTPQTKLKSFKLEPGDCVCTKFQELIEDIDCDLYVDPLGNLVARNFPDTPSEITFNFISSMGEANCKPVLKVTTDEVYSTVKLYRGRKDKTVQSDSAIAKVIERTMTTRDGDVRSEQQALKKIDQMFRDMKDRMRRWTVTFGGDHAKFGRTPKIGDGATISSYRHKVQNEVATVWNVSLKCNAQGRETELELRSREF
ncbi:MAG TPA: hypothetical protein VMY69_01510 [Phycisphaerae bacterium]|nr:hypothetical protein [Phycisphaerae bacterium]